MQLRQFPYTAGGLVTPVLSNLVLVLIQWTQVSFINPRISLAHSSQVKQSLLQTDTGYDHMYKRIRKRNQIRLAIGAANVSDFSPHHSGSGGTSVKLEFDPRLQPPITIPVLQQQTSSISGLTLPALRNLVHADSFVKSFQTLQFKPAKSPTLGKLIPEDRCAA